jgi:hypothetical protein
VVLQGLMPTLPDLRFCRDGARYVVLSEEPQLI